jgi:hypothetical protein
MTVRRELTNPTNLIAMVLAVSEGMAEHRLYSTANEGVDAALKTVGIPVAIPLTVAAFIVLISYFRGRHDLGQDDPKIYLESLEQNNGLDESLVMRNLGGTEALNVQIGKIQPAETEITFQSVPLLPVSEKGTSYPVQQNQGGLLRRNLTRELLKAWDKRDSKDDTLHVTLTITYEDHKSIVFEARCNLVFNGAMYAASPEFWRKEMIQFGNWHFKRLGKKRHRHEQG